MLRKVKMFIWYFKAVRSIRAMVWVTVLAIIRIPRKHAPGINKAKLLADITTKLCEKEITMHTVYGTFNGNLSIVANINPLMEQNIYHLMMENYERNKGRKRIFVNAGAHIGRYLIDMTKNFGYESYGFEPTPETFKYLKKNIFLNGVMDKAHAFNFGLGDKDDIIDFYQSSVSGFNTFCEDQKVLNTEKIQVPIKRFDDLDLKIETKDVALVLMDTEGFEYYVLGGMKEFLKKLNDVDIIVEIHEACEKKGIIVEMMQKMGYDANPIDTGNWLFRR